VFGKIGGELTERGGEFWEKVVGLRPGRDGMEQYSETLSARFSPSGLISEREIYVSGLDSDRCLYTQLMSWRRNGTKLYTGMCYSPATGATRSPKVETLRLSVDDWTRHYRRQPFHTRRSVGYS
jgi:hypothetical protein